MMMTKIFEYTSSSKSGFGFFLMDGGAGWFFFLWFEILLLSTKPNRKEKKIDLMEIISKRMIFFALHVVCVYVCEKNSLISIESSSSWIDSLDCVYEMDQWFNVEMFSFAGFISIRVSNRFTIFFFFEEWENDWLKILSNSYVEP